MKALWVIALICGLIGFVQGVLSVFGAHGYCVGRYSLLYLQSNSTDEAARSCDKKRLNPCDENTNSRLRAVFLWEFICR